MGNWAKFWLAILGIPFAFAMIDVLRTKGFASVEAAGWAQAIGTVGAVGAAIWVANYQTLQERSARAESVRAAQVLAMFIAGTIWRRARILAREMEEGNLANSLRLGYAATATADCLSIARSLDVMKLERGPLMEQYLKLCHIATRMVDIVQGYSEIRKGISSTDSQRFATATANIRNDADKFTREFVRLLNEAGYVNASMPKAEAEEVGDKG